MIGYKYDTFKQINKTAQDVNPAEYQYYNMQIADIQKSCFQVVITI